MWQKVTGTPGGIYATAADVRWGYKQGEMLPGVDRVPFSYGYDDWGINPDQPPLKGHKQRGLGGDLWVTDGRDSLELVAGRVVSSADMIAIADTTADGRWEFHIDPVQPDQWPGQIHNRRSSPPSSGRHSGGRPTTPTSPKAPNGSARTRGVGRSSR